MVFRDGDCVMNIIREYRLHYLTNRRVKKYDPEESHTKTLEKIYLDLLQESSQNKKPINDKSMTILSDLNNNPHYQMLLEDILDLPEEDQKDYLQMIAKTPRLSLVK
jgi:hypothetical protein